MLDRVIDYLLLTNNYWLKIIYYFFTINYCLFIMGTIFFLFNDYRIYEEGSVLLDIF